MSTLRIIHNAGFFSCATIRLIEIIKHFNANKSLPDTVDSSEQFAFYKKELSENIVPQFYEERVNDIQHYKELAVTNEPGEVSFGDYSKFHFDSIAPFVERYFMPSKIVRCMMSDYVENYNIDFENTCAIFYRGNDKQRECVVTPYDEFINKAKEILADNPKIRFLVQPDETEFLEAFTAAFPDNCFWFSETPHMRKKNSAIFYELPPSKKTEHGCYFLAAVLTMAKCKHLITHSGNGGMWAVIYRGNSDNVHQFMNEHIY
jgi:hypothetical protein